MASAVLLSALVVLPYDHKFGAHHFELEVEKERKLRMANLLGFTLDPRRDPRDVVSSKEFRRYCRLSALQRLSFFSQREILECSGSSVISLS